MKHSFLTRHLWVFFGMMIFTVFLTLSALIILISWFVTEQFDPVIKPFYLIVFMIVFVSLSGTAISTLISRTILKPIQELGKAMKQVAEGDFSIQLGQFSTIGEVEQLFRNFNQMVQDLNSIEALRKDFISTVSHEFKTPLSTVKGYVQLMDSPDLSSEQKQTYLKRIRQGTEQLTHMTENILRLSKLEHQVSNLVRTEFRLDEQLRQVIIFLQNQWEARQIEFSIDLIPLKIRADQELLYQVWLNLLDNAIKYNQDQGKIQVKLSENQQTIKVEISDQGIGMSKETLAHLFDKFYQADQSRQTQGNGLGLALVSSIVRLHGGKIKVDSQLNQGSTFTVLLSKTELDRAQP